jgi:hypothetical protein
LGQAYIGAYMDKEARPSTERKPIGCACPPSITICDVSIRGLTDNRQIR